MTTLIIVKFLIKVIQATLRGFETLVEFFVDKNASLSKIVGDNTNKGGKVRLYLIGSLVIFKRYSVYEQIS